jgi:teichuronic acid biosynthesis glycosyltransferase TuaC
VRVLFVIPGEAKGSSMIFARRQAACLVRLGIEVNMFFLRSRTSPLFLIQEWFRLQNEVDRFRPQVLHAHFGTVTAAFAALAAGWGPGRLPLIVTYRGGDLNPCGGSLSERLRAAAGRLLSQAAALAATRIVCVSRQLRARLWWRKDRVTVLASGVDPEVFVPESRIDARLRLGWPLDAPVVLFNAGNDPRVKRADLAHAAVRAAQRALPHLRFQVLDGNVPPEQVPSEMNAADCLLVASDAEGSPTVVQEALACGLPIVSVDVGDVPERLAGVSNTRIVARDPETIGRALVELVTPPRRTNGRTRIDDFSAVEIASQLRALYREAASASRRCTQMHADKN